MNSQVTGMRIAIISEHYPPTSGGVATSAKRIAGNLAQLGVEVTVLTFDHSRPVTEDDYVLTEEDGPVTVRRIGPFFLKQPRPAPSISEKVRAILRRRAFAQMVRILSECRVDIIQSLYLLNAGFVAQFVARELGVPVIAGVRGNDIGRNIFSVDRFATVQWTVYGAARVVCVNEHLQHQLGLAFPDVASRSVVITNSVAVGPAPLDHTAARQRLAHATGWDDMSLRVVFIGTLREKKGALTLLTAMSEFDPERTVRLLVVGPELDAVESRQCGHLWSRLIADGSLHVTGLVPREEVASWSSGCDVVVMPSLDDGMANGLLEGMSLGLCPVGSDIFCDIISPGENGILVPKGDASALAKALRILSLDPQLVERLGQAARASVSRRTPGDEAREYLHLYRSVLAER